MALKSKLVQVTNILLPCLAAIVGLAMLSLAAHIVVWVHRHQDGTVPVHKLWGEWGYYDYKEDLKYLPSNWSMTRPIVLVATGAICALFNTAVAALFSRRQVANTKSDRTKV